MIICIVNGIKSRILSHGNLKLYLKTFLNIYFYCFRVLADNPIKEIHPGAFLNNIWLKRL